METEFLVAFFTYYLFFWLSLHELARLDTLTHKSTCAISLFLNLFTDL